MSDEELKSLKPEETLPYIHSVAKEMDALMIEKVMKLTPELRWLIAARIVNVLFFRFYGPTLTESMKAADKEMENG